MPIQRAIETYHRLLQEGSMAQTTHEHLEALLRERGLFFGNRALCTVLRPHFYDQASWDYVRTETEIILGAFAKAHHACMRDEALRAQLDLEPYEEELFVLDEGVDIPWTTSRLDAFFLPETRYLRFVEYNAETPAGLGYNDRLTDAFMELEVMKRFSEHYHIQPNHGMDDLLGSLLKGYADWGGKASQPNIAIIDWSDVPTKNEHLICKAHFEQHGLQAVLADPRDLVYRDGALWAGDFRVDLLYKRVLISELIQRMGTDNPIVCAVKDRAVLMTNSFSAKLMAKKASFAFLSDETNEHLFTPEEIRVIHEHIPWTRRVEERMTRYKGADIDLIPFITDHRETLVLKPNDEYGGTGVVLGWEATAAEWNETIQKALTLPFVVQERVDPVYRDYPQLVNGQLDISPRFVDADPYIFSGAKVNGCLTRLSSKALLNVTAGAGSVVPMFVIEEK